MQEAVTVSLRDLVDGSISFETLTEAFGPSSLGIIIVKDLPAEFKALRAQVLSNASCLAALSEGELGMDSRSTQILQRGQNKLTNA